MAVRSKRLVLSSAVVGFVLICMIVGALTVALHRTTPSGSLAATMAGMPGMAMPKNMDMSGATMSASSCSLVSPGEIDAALGKLVAPPAASSSKLETDCRYAISSEAAVDIKYTMRVSTTSFEALTTALAAANSSTRHYCGLGDSAYYTQVREGSTTSTALIVLKGSNQVTIIAPGSVSQLESIALRVLPSL